MIQFERHSVNSFSCVAGAGKCRAARLAKGSETLKLLQMQHTGTVVLLLLVFRIVLY